MFASTVLTLVTPQEIRCFLKNLKMSSFLQQRGITTTEQFCKVKYSLKIESEQYNKDEAYSKSIDETLNTLFARDINPTK